MVERIAGEPEAYDVDTVLLYDGGVPAAALLRAVFADLRIS